MSRNRSLTGAVVQELTILNLKMAGQQERKDNMILRYSDLQDRAIDMTKIGGVATAAQVFAILALAEAIREAGDVTTEVKELSSSLMAIADAISDASS